MPSQAGSYLTAVESNMDPKRTKPAKHLEILWMCPTFQHARLWEWEPPLLFPFLILDPNSTPRLGQGFDCWLAILSN